MWPFKKKTPSNLDIPPLVAAALVVSAISLAVAAGCMRWSWLLLDEQVRLRADFAELSNDQAQTQIQYEYWLGKLREERAEWQKVNGKN